MPSLDDATGAPKEHRLPSHLPPAPLCPLSYHVFSAMRRPWPAAPEELAALQEELAEARPSPWRPPGFSVLGGCWVCFAPGPPERAFAAAVMLTADGEAGEAVVAGPAPAPYEPGYLALREGALLEAAVRALGGLPEVLLVNATGRDHPRRAGLALHLGAVLGVPTVGVTHRPLLARGEAPGPQRGRRSPLRLGGEVVGYWLRTRPGVRPLAVHSGWRTDADTAAEVVLASASGARTPEPLRRARALARRARAACAPGAKDGSGQA